MTDLTRRKALALAGASTLACAAASIALLPTTHPGTDPWHVEVEQEVLRLLDIDRTDAQTAKMFRLDVKILSTPAKGIDGALVQLRHLLCPQIGIEVGGPDDCDISALRSVFTVLTKLGGAS